MGIWDPSRRFSAIRGWKWRRDRRFGRRGRGGKSKTRDLRIEQFEQRMLLSIAPVGPDSDALWERSLDRSIERASDLATYSEEALEATDRWVVGLAGGYSSEQLAASLGADSQGETGFVEGTYVWEFPAETTWQQAAEGLSSAEGVEFFYPLVRHEVVKYHVPDDPYFADQWHLQNTGQTGGTPGAPGADANVTPAWDIVGPGGTPIRGAGVQVAIVDDGLEWDHPDLDDNYRADLSYDFNFDDSDPAPDISADNHGTSVAGVAAAEGDNTTGVSGAAPAAELAGLRLISSDGSARFDDQIAANALSWKYDEIDVYNNSWGYILPLLDPGPLEIAAIRDGVINGRGGLGNIYTFAAGNSRARGFNANYFPLTNSRYTITVAAIDHNGHYSEYSTPGASILVSANSDSFGFPGDAGYVGIVTTDRQGDNGYNAAGTGETFPGTNIPRPDPFPDTDYTSTFGGTSSATPLVSGVIALMLEANPDLTWRDVQYILVDTAQMNDPTNPDWTFNGAGYHVNHNYGFGAIDAEAAVNAAKNWESVGGEADLAVLNSGVINVGRQIPDGSNVGVSSTVTFSTDISSIEWVEVTVNVTHPNERDLEIVLTSPEGTQSVLAEQYVDPRDPLGLTVWGGIPDWTYTSARHWGEASGGQWVLTVRDKASGNVGTWNNWEITLYGQPNLGTGPELVAVIPNEGQILDEGEVLQVSPRELTLRFNEGQEIDPGTLEAIQFIRSVDGAWGNGDDQAIDVGWVGIGDRANEVIVRFAETLPDDLYRMVIFGEDLDPNNPPRPPLKPVDPLRNLRGLAFHEGQNLTFDFELDLGAQVVAVVPQPVVRGPVDVTVQAVPADGGVFLVDDGASRVAFEFEDTSLGDGVRPGNVAVEFDGATATPADVAQAIQVAIQAEIAAGNLPGLTDVTVAGATVSLSGPRAQVLYQGAALSIQDLHQRRDQIEVHFNDDDLLDTPQAAENPAFYQLFVTQDSATPADDVMILPSQVDYDPAQDKAVLTFAQDLDQYGTGAFRLRIGNRYQAVVSDFQVAPEAGTSFATAVDVRSDLGGTLAPSFGDGSGPQSLIIGGSVDAWGLDFTLEWPGAIDEPGHRDLPDFPAILIEDHFATGESLPDSSAGVVTIPYHFPDIYGTHPITGAPMQNLITAAQKDRAREVFGLYGQYLGVQFYETADRGIAVATGDLAVFGLQSAPGGVSGVAGGSLALMDYAENWGASHFGGGWFTTAMHEIGHLLGYGHSYDMPPLTIMGSSEDGSYPAVSEPVFPGDHDIVHGQHMYRPDNIDIDMYRVVLDERGLFSAEILAERMDDSSLLDAVVTLYQQYVEDGVTKYRVLARNDDYYSEDSYLELYLGPGTYYVGVTASGNTQYDPQIDDTGVGGVSQGDYELRLSFKPRGVDPNNPETFRDSLTSPSHLVDSTGTLLDGDLDGVPGGVYNFWFNVQSEANTLLVDKLSAAPLGSQDGSLAAPYTTIPAALAAAQPGDIVRIVGNYFDDDDPADPATLQDNLAYEIGYGLFGQPLVDGARLEVPQGVTLVIDAGAVFKLNQANIDVGSSAENVDRSRGALQVLGTPEHSVYFTSYFDETIGADPEPLITTTPEEGDWGGLVFRNNLDYDYIEAYDPASGFPAREVLETQGIFLNYVNHADIRYGGGEVIVNGVRGVYTPIHMVEARPTVTFNTITNSADAAISGDPNSFADTKFQNWDHFQPFTADYERVGPKVFGNRLTAEYVTSVDPDAVPVEHINSINGMFVRIHTLAGRPVEEMEVPGRFDDWDIVHVISENLFINGTPTGPATTPVSTQLMRPDAYNLQSPDGDGIDDAETFAIFDGSVRVVFEFNLSSDWEARGPDSFIPGRVEIRYNRSDDPVPGSPADTPDQMAQQIAAQINWARDNLGLDVTAVPTGGGRIELHSTAPIWSLEGFGTAEARSDGRLRIDPGLIVKLAGSRVETEFGAQLIAEGRPAAEEGSPGYPVVFTSLFDTRYGAGGTFDTTEDTANRAAQPGDWGGLTFAPTATGSIDQGIIAYAGGITPIEGDFARFDPVEIRQAQVRVTNSRFELNDAGSADDRNGRGTVRPATIFVRGAQPVIVNNVFLANDGAVVSVDANAMKASVVPDWGRSTGRLSAFDQYADNYGPMVRANRLGLASDPSLSNEINGMQVRPATLTSESVWDDIDIVHVLQGEIVVPDFHHQGGLRLQSSSEGSLVVKLSGANAGFTATGRALERDDRIGGTIQILGVPGKPVVLTDLADDSVGAGFDLRGQPQTDTNGNGFSEGSPGAWRSIRLDRYSNDRNVAVVNEREPANELSADQNATPLTSEPLGQLAPYEKAGDDNLRLGFEVHGFIRTDDASDVDVYQFDAEAGTEVWIDIDRTTFALDTVVELIDATGTVLACSDNSHEPNSYEIKTDPDGNLLGLGMDRDTWVRHDFYTMNPRDAGMRLVLPGPAGQVRTYYVRVKGDGVTTGKYQMQIRLREMQEVPGSTVQFADIRYATNGIELFGFPQHSPLLGESAESTSPNDTFGNAQYLGNLLASDRAALSVAGYLTGYDDVDWYRVDLDYEAIQSIGGINDLGTVLSTVFDIDYADGMARPDLSLWVFDQQGRLILASLNSNIADDRPDPTEGSSLDDLSRGSLGPADPYIGPAYLPEGNGVTYYVAVTSALARPDVLDPVQYALVRIEPIDSIARVVEEHIERGPSSFVEVVNPNVDENRSADPFGPQRLSLVPDEFTLSDVVLFVNRWDDLYTVDGFTGVRETDVTDTGWLPDTTTFVRPHPYVYGDIAMRNDGRLFTVTVGRDPDGGGNAQPPVRFRELDTGDARNLIVDVPINIVEYRLNAQGNGIEIHPTGGFESVKALEHFPTGNRYVYMVSNLKPGRGIDYTHNLVFRLLPDGTVDDLGEGTDAKLMSTIMPLGQLTTAPTIYTLDATETVPPYTVGPWGRNSDDVWDGLTFTITDDNAGSPVTITFEMEAGYDVYMSDRGAGDVRDGQGFFVNGRFFEFDSGPVLVMPGAANDNLDGVVIRVTGQDAAGDARTVEYEFDNDGAFNSSRIQIPFTNGDSATTLAGALVGAINATTNFQVSAANNGGRVSLVGDTSLGVTNDPAGMVTIVGSYGAAAGVRVPFEETWDLPHGQAQLFGASIETTVENTLAGVDVGYAHRTINTSFPADLNGFGDRLTFLGATSIDVSPTPSFTLIPGSGPGVSAGRVAVPFGADDSAVDLALAIAAAINSQPFNVRGTALGASVELFGVGTDPFGNPLVTVGAPLWFEGEGVGGDVTGLALMPSGEMYAVTDAGGLYRVDNYNQRGFRVDRGGNFPRIVRIQGAGPRMVFIAQLTDEFGRPIPFSGLDNGPPNVEEGRYVDTLFASDASGRLWAFDTLGNLQGVFLDGATSVRAGANAPEGLAFSPIDYNLWHWTYNRWDERGHGVESAWDRTRTPGQGYDPWLEGDQSYYFGLDNPIDGIPNEPQPGAINFFDYSPNRYRTYDMPGGVQGSLTTGTFSLEGFSAYDKPTLYFTYYGETESSASFDSLRVFVSVDGAEWQLIGARPGQIYAVGDDFWRQGRVDLSWAAGAEAVRVRFDFSTAADMDIGRILTGGEYLVAPAAAEMTDGDNFTIDDVTFEFDLGYALVTPNVAGTRIEDAEYFTVSDGTVTLRFEFDKSGDGIQPAGPGEDAAIAVTVANDMTARQVAQAIGDAINTNAPLYGLAVRAYGPNDPAFAEDYPDDNRVFLIGATSVIQGTFNPNPAVQLAMAIEGSAPGAVTGGSVPIYVLPDMTQLEVSQFVTNAVNRYFRSQPDRIYARAAGDLPSGTSFQITGLDNARNLPTTVTFQFGRSGLGSRVLGPQLVEVDLAGLSSPEEVATEIATAVNLASAAFGWQLTAIPAGVWVELTGPQTFYNPAGGPLASYDFNHTTIKLDDRDDDVWGQVEPLMHLYGHPVSRDFLGNPLSGPLAFGGSLPGDSPDDYFRDFRRGQDNAYEGWYIDDVVIGFAEHGEMVTNAPPDATGFQFAPPPGPGDPLVVRGPYQMEIRRGEDYGVYDEGVTYIGTAWAGIPALDTNDRMAQAFTVFAPAASDIAHGDRFWIEDGLPALDNNGVRRQEFIFLDEQLRGPTGNAIPIYFNAGESAGVIADKITAAVNQAYAQGKLRVTADSMYWSTRGTNERVDLWGATAVGGLIGGWGAVPLDYLVFGSVESYAGVPGASELYSDYNGNPISGDRNRERDKGQISIHSNTVLYSQEYGIRVEPAARDAAGQRPHPASGRTLNAPNNLVPGIMIENNVVAFSGTGGILFSGDPNPAGDPVGAIPFGRIVNNTIYGPKSDIPDGVGIDVVNSAGPTLLNNVVANLDVGIRVDSTSRPNTVVGATVYQSNNQNLVGTTASYFETVAPPTAPLFVNPSRENFYPRQGSAVIDSSIDALEERQAYYNAVLEPVGIPVSPIKAPELDLYGQLRQDDPRVAPPPGLGTNVFKDRGAIDRVDFVGPSAALIVPADNDPNDRNPVRHEVVLAGQRLTEFVIGLEDSGVGIDDRSVLKQTVRLLQDGVPLTVDVDYFFQYDATNDVIHLFPAPGIWPSGHMYEIYLDNNDDSDPANPDSVFASAAAIKDLANNPLQPNRPDGTTKFVISLAGLDFGDAPDPPYPSLEDSDGARHLITSGLYLGGGVTGDTDARHNSDASGDLLDDGVQFASGLKLGANIDVTVVAAVAGSPFDGTAVADGILNAWIDFNKDGDWDDGGIDDLGNAWSEHVVVDRTLISRGGTTLTVTDTFAIYVPDLRNTVPDQLGNTFARFRYSSQAGIAATGEAPDGEVEDYQVRMIEFFEDFGDAPDSYHTLAASNGPRHKVADAGSRTIYLGAQVDMDQDGQPTLNADGDDTAGLDDEDGVVFLDPLAPGQTVEIEVTVGSDLANPPGGLLNAWVDFNRDGAFDDPGEQIFTDLPLAVQASPHLLSFNVPELAPAGPAQEGPTYARFRISAAGQTGLSYDGVLASGESPDGEVEDYAQPLIASPDDYGDAPDSYHTLAASNGPRHRYDRKFHLGTQSDFEFDAQIDPDNVAQGDDTLDGVDDEDGVEIIGAVGNGNLRAGLENPIRITVTNLEDRPAYLYAWIDYDGSGTFDAVNAFGDSEEVVFNEVAPDTPLPLDSAYDPDGDHVYEYVLTIPVPRVDVSRDTVARFRLSDTPFGPDPNLSFDGPPAGVVPPDGEVEDHLVPLVAGDASISGYKFDDRNANGVWDREPMLIDLPFMPQPFGSQVLMQDVDESSTGAIPLGFQFQFYGSSYTNVYVNSNGYVTFGGPFTSATPGFPSAVPMIAPFWADVDMTSGGGDVRLNQGISARGNPYIQIDWRLVGYYDRMSAANTDARNSFVLYIEDSPGGDIVAFAYRGMEWTTGDMEGSDGFGAPGAEVGFDAGDGLNFYSLARPSSQAELVDLMSGAPYVFRFDPTSGQPVGIESGTPGITVFIDENDNGLLDVDPQTGEPVELWTVTMRDDPNTPNVDETGYYEFGELFDGVYIVREILPDRWIQTLPGGGGAYTIDLAKGENRTDVDFGNYKLARVSVGDAAIAEGHSGLTEVQVDLIITDSFGAPVTVDYQTQDGTATAAQLPYDDPGDDYVPAQGTFQFVPQGTPLGLWQTRSITSNQQNDYEAVHVSGDVVVWAAPGGSDGGADSEIFLYDLSTGQGRQLTENDGDDLTPAVAGSKIVWAGDDGNDLEIFLYDLTTDTLAQLTDNDYPDVNPRVSASHVAWLGMPIGSDSEVFLYDIAAGGPAVNISDNTFADRAPELDGGNVVWAGGDDVNFLEIYLHRAGIGTERLTFDAQPDERPQISGNNVVWQHRDGAADGADHEIYLYQIDTGLITAVTENTVEDRDPQVSGDNVVWTGFDGTDNEIFYYNVAFGGAPNPAVFLNLSNNAVLDEHPRVSGDRVVWSSLVGSNWEVFFYDLSTRAIPQNMSESPGRDWKPQVSSELVVWRGFDGNDYEILVAIQQEPFAVQTLTLQVVGDLFVERDEFFLLDLIDANLATLEDDQGRIDILNDDGGQYGLDYGDAPASYATLLADNGARHVIDPDVYLGQSVDAEGDGQPSATADGDDTTTSDDEDGVAVSSLQAGMTSQITVTASVAGVLSGWIDFDGDGRWTAAEQVFDRVPVVAGANALGVTVPADAVLGQTYARFRFSSAQYAEDIAQPTGSARDGEVEDYGVEIVGPIPPGTVALVGRRVVARGTDDADLFEFRTRGTDYEVKLNGQAYLYDAGDVDQVDFAGGAGEDTALVWGTAGNEAFTLYPDHGRMVQTGVEVNVFDTTEIRVYGRGGADQAELFGSAETDAYTGTAAFGRLVQPGNGIFLMASDVDQIAVRFGQGGDDVARLYGTAGDEQAQADPDTAILVGAGFSHRVDGAVDVSLFADEIGSPGNRGTDTVQLTDSAGDDVFTARLNEVRLAGNPYSIRAVGFDRAEATASQGNDQAWFYGSVNDDHYEGTPETATFTGTVGGLVYTNIAHNFPWAVAFGKGGSGDTAVLRDSNGKDGFRGTFVYGRMAGVPVDPATGNPLPDKAYFHRTVRFENVTAYSTEGRDVARFDDGPFNDEFHGTPTVSWMDNSKAVQRVEGFWKVVAADVVNPDGAGGDRDVGTSVAYLTAHRIIEEPDGTRVGTGTTPAGDPYEIRASNFDRYEYSMLSAAGGPSDAELAQLAADVARASAKRGADGQQDEDEAVDAAITQLYS